MTNIFPESLTVGRLDDRGNLETGNQLPPNFPEVGDEVVFVAEVTNEGGIFVTDFDVTFFFTGGSVGFTETIRIQGGNQDDPGFQQPSENPNGIDPGETVKVLSHSIDSNQGSPWIALDGIHELRVFVDSDDEILGDDPTDNVLQRKVRVLSPAEPTAPTPDRVKETPIPLVRLQTERVLPLNQVSTRGQTRSVARSAGVLDEASPGKVMFFHLYDGVRKDNPFEITDKPTQSGGVSGEPIRKSSDTMRISVRLAGELTVPNVEEGLAQRNVTQNAPLKRQIEQLKTFKGQMVRAIASKSSQIIRGFVQDIQFEDDTDSDNAVDAQIVIKNPQTDEDEGAVTLAQFSVPFITKGGESGEDGERPGEVEDDPLLPNLVQGGGVSICKAVSSTFLTPGNIVDNIDEFDLPSETAKQFKEHGAFVQRTEPGEFSFDALENSGVMLGLDQNGKVVTIIPQTAEAISGEVQRTEARKLTNSIPTLDQVEGGAFVTLSSIMENVSNLRFRRERGLADFSLPGSTGDLEVEVATSGAFDLNLSNSRAKERLQGADKALDRVNRILQGHLDGEFTLVRETEQVIVPGPTIDLESLENSPPELDRVFIGLGAAASLDLEGAAFGRCEPR